MVKAFTVKRRPLGERWSLEEAHAMKGTPGKPNPGTNDQRIPVQIRVPEKPIPRKDYQHATRYLIHSENAAGN